MKKPKLWKVKPSVQGQQASKLYELAFIPGLYDSQTHALNWNGGLGISHLHLSVN